MPEGVPEGEAPSVHLTNLPKNTSHEQASEQARESSQQIIKVAADAVKNHTNLQHLIVLEAAPRYDQWAELNEYGNEELHEALKTIENEEVRNKITIGRHNLQCVGGLRLSRYGDPSKRNVDGVHLRGSSGNISLSRSIALIMAGAGLASTTEAEALLRTPPQAPSHQPSDFQRQRSRRRQGGPAGPAVQQYTIPTQNRFSQLGN